MAHPNASECVRMRSQNLLGKISEGLARRWQMVCTSRVVASYNCLQLDFWDACADRSVIVVDRLSGKSRGHNSLAFRLERRAIVFSMRHRKVNS